jgi:hypothetical protein
VKEINNKYENDNTIPNNNRIKAKSSQSASAIKESQEKDLLNLILKLKTKIAYRKWRKFMPSRMLSVLN